MPVEAELTAVLRDPDRVRAALAQRAIPEHATYADTYYDWPDRSMDKAGYELRVRAITTNTGQRVLLTYKQPAIDSASGSKPEHETTADNPTVLHTILAGLGLRELIAFTKHCDNYQFTEHGYELLATIVQIPELDGQTFLEIETTTHQENLPTALHAIRNVLTNLGVTDTDLTTQPYTNRVAQQRQKTTTTAEN